MGSKEEMEDVDFEEELYNDNIYTECEVFSSYLRCYKLLGKT